MSKLFTKLKEALTNSSAKISQTIDNVFYKRKLDEDALASLEEVLLKSDLGTAATSEILTKIKAAKFNKEITPEEVKQELAIILEYMISSKLEHRFNLADGFNIILMCGVNGNGKTTTIGKLASRYTSQGKKVAIAACDTFRAAAVEQIELWSQRANAHLVKANSGADPASVAHNAISYCQEHNFDVLFIDTAGRLQNHSNLMAELAKIIRVIEKKAPNATTQKLLVIDATTGQNAHVQAEEFAKTANITGLVITKLDGSARAGSVVGIINKAKIPLHFVGVGEGVGDLKDFSAHDFTRALVGLNSNN